ncbi:MAG TPA: glycoside hydrolase family 3 N-terminal domain-containing protein [Anaerolineales bacterium]|nr:glycoside hydrolase family 3 N-terminal domain-containing protein [Anaerolineales bacterium]
MPYLHNILKHFTLISVKRLIYWALIFVLLNPFLIATAQPQIQAATIEKAQALLETLSPEERVGQLFLITFQGVEAGPGTPLSSLIANNHVGGVVLRAENNNFNDGETALAQTINLVSQIQLDRWTNAQNPQVDPVTGENFTTSYIPLFVGISQEGDSYPHDQILNKLTPLPNQMTIGATWQPQLAAQVGTILGQELAALGINLLFGPSLDVLEDPQPEGTSGVGIRSFGGDPFWVGEMGKAYISGVHQGSEGKVAVTALHFPGIGAADRLPEEEISTVRKSLEELQNFDLVPFYSVTGNATSPNNTADALLASHIRYQGFQGNIRTTTRPVSFDQQAFNLLMEIPALASWRDSGGVMVSDDLGSKAVRLFYELTNPNQPFDARRIVLNAFLAGNDLLYLGNIVAAGEEQDTYTTAADIQAFFAQKYREDPAFAERVDQSVLRILGLKFRLYDTFSLSNTQPPPTGIENMVNTTEIAFEVSREAVTLISPSLQELDNAIPDAPNRLDRIVFISDQRIAKQCSACSEVLIPTVDALQQAVLRLYGPQTSNQVTPNYLRSYSYSELQALLDGDPNAFQIELDIRRAQWVVFAMLDLDQAIPSSQALHRFLSERPDLFQQKRLIVFALNAPYYLDATNISKLTAYYALYNKTPGAINVAARLLFRELNPGGFLPVSVSGVGYDLISATSPAANQTIALSIDSPVPEVGEGTSTPEPQPTPEFRFGNTIPVRTGVILDHNGNHVPDGTPVQFIVNLNGELSGFPQTVSTKAGIARTTIQVTGSGLFEIRVESEPAKISDVLRFEIPPENGEIISSTPTEQPTATPSPTSSPTAEPVGTPIPQPIRAARPNLGDWFATILFTLAIGSISYRIAAYLGQVRWGIRSGFLAAIGSLLAYSYLAMELPGSETIIQNYGGWGVLFVTFSGAAFGILLSWVWRKVRLGSSTQDTSQ